MTSIFKILSESEWQEFQASGQYDGSALDIKDGYIHLSTSDQIEYVVNKYYKNSGPLYVAEFLVSDFSDADLKWELSSSGQQTFPHLYNQKLKFSKVVGHQVLG